jgi:hypothetical protein
MKLRAVWPRLCELFILNFSILAFILGFISITMEFAQLISRFFPFSDQPTTR